ncbi:MAG TPA: polyprenyl synthetase family protein [Alphaproteobacteria bacterium]
MNFTTYLKTVPVDIDQRINAYLGEWIKTANAYSPLLEPLYAQFADACAGGKRLRASLVKLGFDMVGGYLDEKIYPAAMAYEIFQAGILAHDDIIDNSPLRRGKPTVFKALEKRCATDLRGKGNAAHYGVSQTICLGDMGLYMAIQLINDSAFNAEAKNKAVSFFTKTVIDTIAGELLDVEIPYLNDINTITKDDLLAICRYKTARYTIVGPLSLGAILGKGSQYTLEAISDYGDHLGIAFQLKDDLLGIFGDEATTGKSATSDIEEGKITLPYWYALQQATIPQKEFLQKHYGTGPVMPEIHDEIKQIFTDTGAKNYTEIMMDDLVAKALDATTQVTANDAYRNILRDLANYMIKREK